MSAYTRAMPTGFPVVTDAEVRVNTLLVRLAKRAKERRGLPPVLNSWELDAILPAVDCKRTRNRLRAGRKRWREQGVNP